MKKLFIVANWKSNKLASEINAYAGIQQESNELREVIICPPFTLLSNFKTLIDEKKLSYKLGAQNISPYTAGAYTGEINGQQIKEFADYVIIGHSERRSKFGESEDALKEKVEQALANKLTPIYCIQDENTFVPDGASLVAYEPVSAIGTGNPDTPENAEKVATAVMSKNPHVEFMLYGGSVTPENIASFVEQEHINGVLIGGASLDPERFEKLINATS
jgi:triosephosphate isomerase